MKKVFEINGPIFTIFGAPHKLSRAKESENFAKIVKISGIDDHKMNKADGNRQPCFFIRGQNILVLKLDHQKSLLQVSF